MYQLIRIKPPQDTASFVGFCLLYCLVVFSQWDLFLPPPPPSLLVFTVSLLFFCHCSISKLSTVQHLNSFFPSVSLSQHLYCVLLLSFDIHAAFDSIDQWAGVESYLLHWLYIYCNWELLKACTITSAWVKFEEFPPSTTTSTTTTITTTWVCCFFGQKSSEYNEICMLFIQKQGCTGGGGGHRESYQKYFTFTWIIFKYS